MVGRNSKVDFVKIPISRVEKSLRAGRYAAKYRRGCHPFVAAAIDQIICRIIERVDPEVKQIKPKNIADAIGAEYREVFPGLSVERAQKKKR